MIIGIVVITEPVTMVSVPLPAEPVRVDERFQPSGNREGAAVTQVDERAHEVGPHRLHLETMVMTSADREWHCDEAEHLPVGGAVDPRGVEQVPGRLRKNCRMRKTQNALAKRLPAHSG